MDGRGLAPYGETLHPEVANSDSLVLNTHPTLNQSAYVFRNGLQIDAAWQISLERRWKKPHDLYLTRAPWDVSTIRSNYGWRAVNFPQLLRDINKLSSRIRCKFNPGEPWEEERIEELVLDQRLKEDSVAASGVDLADQRAGATPRLVAWLQDRSMRSSTLYARPYIKTDPWLPSFYALLAEHLCPSVIPKLSIISPLLPIQRAIEQRQPTFSFAYQRAPVHNLLP